MKSFYNNLFEALESPPGLAFAFLLMTMWGLLIIFIWSFLETSGVYGLFLWMSGGCLFSLLGFIHDYKSKDGYKVHKKQTRNDYK